MRRGCDSCIKEFVKLTLNDKVYGWVQVNSARCLFKYSKRLIMETGGHNDKCFLLFKKIDWNK